VVSVLRGVEPVALLPRGPAAVDSGAWSQHAVRIRDLRRAALRLRAQPDRLLDGLGSPSLATTVGFLLRATARRTPIIVNGTLAAVAALFVADIAQHAADWWQGADASPEAVQARAYQELGLQPIFTLGIAGPPATAGLLTLPVLRAAVAGCA
jgi:nicotinate-nucleotide--dimethylbenzimidazole phosphoribosyltransferase